MGANVFCHRMPCAGNILGAEKNRSGSIKQAHGITKIIALFRGLEGDVRRFRDVLLWILTQKLLSSREGIDGTASTTRERP